MSCLWSRAAPLSSSAPVPHSLLVRGESFALLVRGQVSRGSRSRHAALHQRLPGRGDGRVRVARRGELPGPGAQHPLHEVPHGEEQQHDEHPGQFPGDHGDVVVRVVHELLATGDRRGVVPLRAAHLVVPAQVHAAFSDRVHDRADQKAHGEHRQSPGSVGKHLC